MELHFKLDKLSETAKTVVKNAHSKTLLFYGEMGAGKTTLISAIVSELGGEDKTSSPTFSIVNEYKVADGIVYHFDFYRLKNQYEAMDMGIEDYFYSGAWNLIEWPEKIIDLLPENVTIIELSMLDNNTRVLKVSEK
ncbi:tRNA (adenosine(37)-N6)-threonylcarbamoyltransferase complex ATPase subunit type 1 TsaE [Flavobacteriaceae bacterium]|nr:tRNA (adenosine(37)-N6)-threonylcarbamoyltransferase complex ATPase subunit type 1 TsaE [Flavobacteriaceae bacterium]MDG1383915.1 tRNA (adenosine(37)-N6)-threonylcarbamoyltransferase complex ATPase subunit type 1 TsaE [Flavobacteriaceae bacterium]